MATPLERRLYSVGEARRLARRALPRAIFDFVDGGAEDEVTLRRNEAAFAAVELLPRPLAGSIGPRPAPQPVRPRARHAADRRAHRAFRACSGPTASSPPPARRPPAGIPYCLSHGSTCTIEALAGDGRGAALDAGVHVPRPWADPLLRRARAGGGLRRAGADHRQPGAGQPRARPPQRLLDPAAAHGRHHARHGGPPRLAVAHARPARPHLRQLCRCRRRPAHASPAAWRACSTPALPGPTSPGCVVCGAGRCCSRACCIPTRRGAQSPRASTASSSATMAAASSTARRPPSRPCPRSSPPWLAASRSWSTAASAAAPTSPGRSRWAPRPA